MRAWMKILAFVLVFSSLFMTTLALAQEEPLFSVSPSDFTVPNASPLGQAYRLERKLVIRNGDTIERTFILSVGPPLSENLRPGYEPIPNENWMILTPALIVVEENSWGEVEMFLKIPRWENLTGQSWEAWITVTRMAELGEIVELELISKAKIITTEELPPLPEAIPLSTIVIIAVGVGAAAVIIGAWVWSKRKAGRGVGMGAFSRSWG